MDFYDELTPCLWLTTALAVGWVVVCDRVKGAFRVAAIALLLTTLHWGSWNKPIYESGRQWLIEAGVYNSRLFFKLVIGVVLFALLKTQVGRVRLWFIQMPRILRVAGAMALVDFLFILTRTLSVDGWMPGVISTDPGKGLFQCGLAAIACLAATTHMIIPGLGEHSRPLARGPVR